jgi:hypothetical protein
MRPVVESSFKPTGNPLAENLIGRFPVAEMLNKNGEPGLTPKTFGPVMRGTSGAGGVRISDFINASEAGWLI